MSLQEPNLKMSKSHFDPRSRIVITDQPEEIRKKLMAALTDSTNSVSYDPIQRPGVANLLHLLSHFDAEGKNAEELGKEHAGLSLKAFKSLVSDNISASLQPIRESYELFIDESMDKDMKDMAERGASTARKSAEKTMVLVRNAVGL